MIGLVKLCGIARAEDLVAARAAGADRFGIVLDFPLSPRSLSVERAIALVDDDREGIAAVVVDPSNDLLELIRAEIRPQTIQLSGQESPERAGAIRNALPGVEVWKVVHVSNQDLEGSLDDLVSRIGSFGSVGVSRILLDRGTGAMPGGTGQKLSWPHLREVVAASPISIVLAGGLTPENVAEAIQVVRPSGVDVATGTEWAPGMKDAAKLERFTQNARAAFAQVSL